jgi:hypothetical protein
MLTDQLFLARPSVTQMSNDVHLSDVAGAAGVLPGALPPSHTLALRGLKELFFQLCCCVSFWFWRKIGFGFTYLRTLLNNFFGTNIFLIVVEVLRYSVRQFR